MVVFDPRADVLARLACERVHLLHWAHAFESEPIHPRHRPNVLKILI